MLPRKKTELPIFTGKEHGIIGLTGSQRLQIGEIGVRMIEAGRAFVEVAMYIS